MKNRNFIKNSIAILLPISMGIGVLLGTANKHVNSASAYTGASLPTTIKLNDPDEFTIRGYYADLNSLNENERKGDNLLKNLKTILSDGQKYYNYDSGDLVWKMYEITDRDWDMSPASSTTYGTYNASTNTITDYQYGSNSTPKNNPYVRAYYMDRSQTNIVTAWGSHQQTDPNGINREHLWAKAEGFDGSGGAGARGDPMHLVAANGYANNIHSNNFYGYVDRSRSYVDVKNKFSVLGHNYSGYSKTYPSSSITVFEPQDCDKGDIARAIFYMAARYNNIAGKSASQETFDADNPNLLLTNDLSKWKSSGYTSTATSPGYHGLITDLLEWNRIDKPDAYEIHRNNLLYTNFTNNRNPFIDFPEWADYIWGDQSASATPATDTLNGGGGGTPTVTVTSLEITKKPSKLVYNSGESLDLTGMVVKANKSDGTSQTLNSTQYSVTPTGALKTSDTEVVVSYSGKSASFAIAVKSSGGGTETQSVTMSFTGSTTTNMTGNNDAATVGLDEESWSVIGDKGGNGNYPGLNKAGQICLYGSTTNHNVITISNLDGYTIKSATIKYGSSSNNNAKITVGSSEITGSGTDTEKTYAIESDSFSITHNYSGTTQVYISEIEIVYSSSGGSPNVPVTEITLNSSTITTEIGETFSIKPTISPANATVQLVSWSSSNQSVAVVNEDGVVTAVSDGTATITCSALDGSNITATCTVTVNEPVTLESLSLSGDYATEFYLNDEFSNTGMIVTAHYSDGTSVDVSDEAECSGFDSSTTGTKTINVSYDGISTTYSVTVKETRLEDNQRLFVASKSGVGNGEALNSYTDDPIIIAFSKNSGSNPPKYYSSTQSFRVYGGNTFTITGTKKITKIEFEMASSDTVGSNAISANVGSLSGTTWTGNESSVVFTIGGTSGQRNIVSIKVTYDENSQEIAALSSISLSGTHKTEFFKGDTFSYSGLIVTAHYSDNTEKTVTPTSVSTPTMTTTGTKTVTVSYTENNIIKNATYNISVIAVVATSIELTGNFKTEFTQGDAFSTSGMTVVEHFNNGTSQNHLPSSCTITGYDMNTVGEQTVTVTYGGNSATYTINVKSNGKVVEQKSISLSIETYATNNQWDNATQYTEIKADDNITLTASGTSISNTGKYYDSDKTWRFYHNEGANLTISAPKNGKIKGITVTFTVKDNGALLIGGETLTSGTKVTTNSQTVTIDVGSTSGTKGKAFITDVVVDYEIITDSEQKILSSIAVSGDYKTSFNVGDDFSFGGTVTATYSDETTEDVTESATFSGYDLSTAGEQTVSVTYDGKTTTYSITVSSSVVPPTPVGGNVYSKISSLDDIEDGAKYIIGYEDGNTLKAMPNVFASQMSSSDLTISSDSTVSDPDYEYCVTLSKKTTADSVLVQVSNGTNYLNGASSGTSFSVSTTGSDWTVTQSNGSFLFSFGTSERGLVYRTSTYNKFGNYSTKSIGNEYHTISLFKEVIVTNNYSLVTDVSDLRTGDKIVIAAPNTSYTGVTTYYSLSTNRNITSAIYGCEIDFNNNIVTPADETELITVERNGNDLSFKLSDGKYIASYGSGSTAINLVDSSSDSSARFTATANTDNSIKLISENTDHNYRRLKFNYSTGDRYYRCYTTNSSTGVDPMIFKYQPQVEADTWAKDFLAQTEYCDLTYWSSLASSYNELSPAAKQEIYSAVSDASTDMNYRAQAMARYEKTLSVKSADAFISERQVDSVRPLYLPIVAPKTDTILIVVFSILGVSAIGGYYFVKRKKEDRV